MILKMKKMKISSWFQKVGVLQLEGIQSFNKTVSKIVETNTVQYGLKMDAINQLAKYME